MGPTIPEQKSPVVDRRFPALVVHPPDLKSDLYKGRRPVSAGCGQVRNLRVNVETCHVQSTS